MKPSKCNIFILWLLFFAFLVVSRVLYMKNVFRFVNGEYVTLTLSYSNQRVGLLAAALRRKAKDWYLGSLYESLLELVWTWHMVRKLKKETYVILAQAISLRLETILCWSKLLCGHVYCLGYVASGDDVWGTGISVSSPLLPVLKT